MEQTNTDGVELSFDEHQDIARSSYADMLNDDERNKAYNLAIRARVSQLVLSKRYNPKSNKFFKCCDIGTGSGLLSMMIVRAFKDFNYEQFHVTAFEAFRPMAECAKRVIVANNMTQHITVIPTRSEDYSGTRPNFDLLVAELLDTELIGEGCLLTYRHAIENLCSPECIMIPEKARIYIQPVHSPTLLNRHSIRPSPSKSLKYIYLQNELKICCGLPEIDDIQAESLNRHRSGYRYEAFTAPKVVFNINFGDLDSLRLTDQAEMKFKFDRIPGIDLVVLMWWDIDMYDQSLYTKYINQQQATTDCDTSFSVLSCSFGPDRPWRTRDQLVRKMYGRGVWREHWIQGVYYLATHLANEPGLANAMRLEKSITIYAYHDSHSMWFDLVPCQAKLPKICSCGVHRELSRAEIAFLNSKSMHKLIDATFHKTDICCDGQQELQVGEFTFYSRRNKAIDTGDDRDINVDGRNHIKWIVRVRAEGTCLAASSKLIDYSLQDEVSWKCILNCYIDGLSVDPFATIDIMCSQVIFSDLNRIRTNVTTCEGFDLRQLDVMIRNSEAKTDKSVESHYLWQYESRIVSSPNALFSLNLAERETIFPKVSKMNVKFDVPYKEAGLSGGWALVFWAKYKLTNGSCLDTGPKENSWNRHFKQLVHFLHDHQILQEIKANNCIETDRSISVEVSLNREGIVVRR